MAITEYTGARYVPVFGRVGEESIQWDNSKEYEPLTIVLHEGNSFTSRQYVPVGIGIDNAEFWAETGNYNAQVEQYRQEVQELKNRKIYMPENYGAVGNGIHDDTTAIKQIFDIMEPNSIFVGTGKYLITEQVTLPRAHSITISGGEFISGLEENYIPMFINDASNAPISQTPSGYPYYSEDMIIENVKFNGNHQNTCIKLEHCLRINITNCTFKYFNQYGVNLINNDCHEVIINNCNFVGKKHNETITSGTIGVVLDVPDCSIIDSVFLGSEWGIKIQRSYNTITGCHLYCGNSEMGGNIDITSAAGYLIISNCYIDGGIIQVTDPWITTIDNCYFFISDSTRLNPIYINMPQSKLIKGFNIVNMKFNDVRTNRTDLNFIYSTNPPLEMSFNNDNNLSVSGYGDAIIIDSPYSIFNISNAPIAILTNSAGRTGTIANNGTLTSNEEGYISYTVEIGSNYINAIYTGAESAYPYALVPIYVTHKTRLIAIDLTTGKPSQKYVYDAEFNNVGSTYSIAKYGVTLDPGLYYIAVYKNTKTVIMP